jgi:hypothetical protein
MRPIFLIRNTWWSLIWVCMSFQNFQIFAQNPHVLAVYDFLSVWGTNKPKLYISWSWPSYSGSVIHNDHVYDFLHVFLKSTFRSKSIGVSLRFYRKLNETPYFLSMTPIFYIGNTWWSYIWVFTGFKKLHICTQNL